MADAIDYLQFLRLVESGVESTARQLAAACAGQHLIGYALCTDDCVCTLFHVACTAELAAAEQAFDIRFAPVEWKLDAVDPGDLEVASHSINRLEHETDEDFARHCDQAFECLVVALERARDKGLFQDQVFLSVLSTDPSREMQRRWRDSVLRLNVSGVVREWRRYELAEARKALSWYRARTEPKSWDMLDRERALPAKIAALEAELADSEL